MIGAGSAGFQLRVILRLRIGVLRIHDSNTDIDKTTQGLPQKEPKAWLRAVLASSNWGEMDKAFA